MSELIERQAALNALMDAVKSVGVLDADDIKTVFDALPTIQPEKAQLSKEDATSDTISRQAAIDAIERNACNTQRIMDAVNNLPPAQPDGNDQEFIKLTVGNSNGRPYYSIIYLEYDKNGVGHDFVGYSSYSLDVISDYLKKYFMSPTQPEPKEGHWIRRDCGLDVECKCSKCGYRDFVEPRDEYWFKRNYCPNCGAKMTISK